MTPTSSDASIATVQMEDNVLIIEPQASKSGSISVSLVLSDGLTSDNGSLSVTINPVDNPPDVDDNTTDDDVFEIIPQATGAKPNPVSPTEYKEIIIKGITYAVYSDTDENGKLSLKKKIDADNWEYVTGYIGFSSATATSINPKYNRRTKSLSINFNDGSIPKFEVIPSEEL